MGAPEGRIVIYWTLVAEGGEMLACDLCRTSDGLLLRCVSDNHDVVLSEFVGSAAEAIEMATAWKELYLAGRHWSERGTDWDRETPPHSAKARTVLEQKAEDRGTLPRPSAADALPGRSRRADSSARHHRRAG